MLIGLTGLILSGKSIIRKYLHKKGVNTFDCDEISRILMSKGQPLYKKIINFYGNQILNTKEDIDRKKLSEIVFKDPVKLKKLEQLSHPEIIKYIFKNIKKNELNLIEASLLFESGLNKKMDLNIFVDSEIENLIKRNNKSRKISSDILNKILIIQTKKKHRKLNADIILRNNSTLKILNEKNKILFNLIKNYEKKIKRETIFL